MLKEEDFCFTCCWFHWHPLLLYQSQQGLLTCKHSEDNLDDNQDDKGEDCDGENEGRDDGVSFSHMLLMIMLLSMTMMMKIIKWLCRLDGEHNDKKEGYKDNLSHLMILLTILPGGSHCFVISWTVKMMTKMNSRFVFVTLFVTTPTDPPDNLL